MTPTERDWWATAEHHWYLLMRCRDCNHRVIEHVDNVCEECPCDQSDRGLTAYSDDLLMAHAEHYEETCP